jgi:hypothetical protein
MWMETGWVEGRRLVSQQTDLALVIVAEQGDCPEMLASNSSHGLSPISRIQF